MTPGAIKEIIQQALRPIVGRVGALESARSRQGSDTKADSSVVVILWAQRPTSPRRGQMRFFSDKTLPGAPVAGVLAVFDGSIWVADGQDVAGM